MKLNELKALRSEEAAIEAVNPEELKNASPEELAKAIRTFLDAKKGEQIRILHVEEHTALTSYFVVASGLSSTHVKALGDELDFQTTRRGYAPLHTEGRAGGEWNLLDYGSVIVHIFTAQAREFYNIEHLYGDATLVE